MFSASRRKRHANGVRSPRRGAVRIPNFGNRIQYSRAALRRHIHHAPIGNNQSLPRALEGASVRLELLCAPHIAGVSAEPVTVAGEKTETILKVRFGARPGPFNLPATIRGTAILNGATHVAEVKLELVPATSADAR